MKAQQLSQCQTIGLPRVKTWTDYRQGCLNTYGGGHHNDGQLEAFQHGMGTVFNLLEAEFPPAELCKAAPDLLEACKALLALLDSGLLVRDTSHDSEPGWAMKQLPIGQAVSNASAAIARATGEEQAK